ncbi:serine/threonine-protein kinase [Nereida sp. NH-UV-3]|uniref:serine/threonine-protein kinase n=1 Tax=Nereida TaxID=282198 RepID=UPI0036F25EA3
MTNTLEPGYVIQDTYRLHSELGEGGMGQTFRAVNIPLGHDVAIKVLSNPSYGEKGKQLFLREAQLLRGISHPGVVRLETALMGQNKRFYIVMEYLTGKPLSYFLASGARLAPDDVLKLGLRMASALKAVHDQGIVHRDIAPDNIMVVDDNIEKAKLIDFGVASNTIGQEKSIIGDSFVGKFNYSAPEQLGLFGGKISGKSDLYALALVLMRAMGIDVPGQDQGAGVIEYRRGDVKLPSHVDPVVARVLHQLLKADPQDRPEEAESLFQAALKGEATSSTSSGSKFPILVAIGGVAIAAAAAGFFLLMPKGAEAPQFDVAPGLQGQAPQNQIQPSVQAASPELGPEPAPTPTLALQDSREIAEIRAKIEAGGEANLNDALSALVTLSRSSDMDASTKQIIHVMLAHMYDPKFHSTTTSPFPQSNISAAIRAYEAAQAQGANVTADLIRLKEAQ